MGKRKLTEKGRRGGSEGEGKQENEGMREGRRHKEG